MKTNQNPLLEEIWKIKDQLAAEAGYDLRVYCDRLEAWVAEHPHPGPIARNAEELRALFSQWEENQPSKVHEQAPRGDQHDFS